MSQDRRPIRVLIVDDHPVVRHGLRSLLAGHPDLEVVGEAGHGAEALSWLVSHEVDVILLDIQMKGQGGLEVARRVHVVVFHKGNAAAEFRILGQIIDLLDKALTMSVMGMSLAGEDYLEGAQFILQQVL